MEAARAIFVADGYDAVSVRKVAGAVGISHGTLYLYFRDKDDLLLQTCEEQFAQLLTSLRRLPRTRGPEERLPDSLRLLGRFGLEHPHEFFLTTGLYAAVVHRCRRSDWGPMAEQVGNFLHDLFAETLVDLGSDTGGAESLAWMCMASVGGTVAYAYANDVDVDLATYALDQQVTLLMCGLRGSLKHERTG